MYGRIMLKKILQGGKMHEYLIEGGFPIKGSIRACGNKNAALPCIAAALLTDETVILHYIPPRGICQAKIFRLRDFLEQLRRWT